MDIYPGMDCFKKNIFLLVLSFLIGASILKGEDVGHLPLGNFSLSTSQQISPLVSFGQTIVDKGQTQFFVFADSSFGPDNYSTDIYPYVMYGIRDDLAVSLYVPFSPGNKYGSSYSSGIEDMYVQLEYAFYTRVGSYFEDQATIVADVIFPTGSSSKSPPTGAGSTSFFLGSAFSHTTYNWYFFVSPGAVLTTSKEGTKLGDQIVYQWGLGRDFPSPVGWIFAWMVEFDGQYSWKSKTKGVTDPDFGGNVIYLTPSLWFSSEKYIIQFGAGYPIVQYLFGNQLKQNIALDFSLGVTF